MTKRRKSALETLLEKVEEDIADASPPRKVRGQRMLLVPDYCSRHPPQTPSPPARRATPTGSGSPVPSRSTSNLSTGGSAAQVKPSAPSTSLQQTPRTAAAKELESLSLASPTPGEQQIRLSRLSDSTNGLLPQHRRGRQRSGAIRQPQPMRSRAVQVRPRQPLQSHRLSLPAPRTPRRAVRRIWTRHRQRSALGTVCAISSASSSFASARSQLQNPHRLRASQPDSTGSYPD